MSESGLDGIDLDEPLFSRTNRTGDPMGELRVNLAVRKLAVIDAVAASESRAAGRFVSRTDLVDRIISDWVAHKADEASLISQAIKEYPTVMEKE